jgi:hypothetical protein
MKPLPDEKQVADLIRRGEGMVRGAQASNQDLQQTAGGLLLVTGFPYCYSWKDRNHAAVLLVSLGARYELVFGLIREEADGYVRHQFIDDAFPWTPNADEIFSRTETLKSQLRKVAVSAATTAQDSLFRTFAVLQSEVRGLSDAFHLAIPATAGIVLILSIVLAVSASLRGSVSSLNGAGATFLGTALI